MGGFGSTRWGGYRRAVALEECAELRLDEARATLEGRAPAWRHFSWATSSAGRGWELVWQVAPGRTRGDRCLLYAAMVGVQEERGVVPLLTADGPLGRPVLWLGCPVCGRRCRGLYLRPGSVHLACRLCHRLTYLSRQAHDKRGRYRPPLSKARRWRGVCLR